MKLGGWPAAGPYGLTILDRGRVFGTFAEAPSAHVENDANVSSRFAISALPSEGYALLDMPSIVVPFRAGKTRIDANGREVLARAMLEDVLAACREVGMTIVADAEGGQGEAVQQVLAGIEGEVAIVNADLPCVTAEDVRVLLEAVPEDGMAIAPALDGTTNALALATTGIFAPLYGPGSAEEFRAHASQLGVASVVVSRPNLADDVDSLEDLARLGDRLGPHTKAAL